VLVHGEGGTGKTIASVEALRQHGEGFFARASEFVGVRARRYTSVDDRRLIRRAERTSFLVLDDVGEEAAEHWHFIAQLLTLRYDRGGRTICTTNMDREQFARRYKDRVVDRWRHRGFSVEATEILRPDRLKQQSLLENDDGTEG
jgi:DNA replication protein DnaC